MKRYEGRRRLHVTRVTVDGRPLKRRLDLRSHSPAEFEWGYGGSGPAQLALALLADHLGNDQEAVAYHQHFKFAVIARVLRPDSFCVSFYGWPEADRFLSVWKRCGLRPVSHFVWIKDYASRKGYTESCHEMAYLLAKEVREFPSIRQATCCRGTTLATFATPRKNP